MQPLWQRLAFLGGHPAKASDSEWSGSAAWTNAVRNRLFTGPLDPEATSWDRVILRRAKSNWSGIGDDDVLRYVEGAYDLVDELEQKNLIQDAVLLAITEAADDGVQLGCWNNGGGAARFIGSKTIRVNDTSRPLTKTEIMDAVDELVRRKLVDNVSGKKGKNGLWPIKAEDVFEQVEEINGDEEL